MKFLYYDIIFLIVSCIAVALFLYKNKKKVQREGILFLYRTKIGIKTIEQLSKRSPIVMSLLIYSSIITGYILMVVSMYFIVLSVHWVMTAATLPKIPPLMPLVPYLPSLFDIDFLPPFYFTYWIITIGIVAVSHEFSHGIFARFGKIKLKSTGFGFLGPFLAAFVEMDEKQMAKKPMKTQLSTISAGSFANFAVAIFFIILANLFFFSLYSPSGVYIEGYSYGKINISGITSIGDIGISNPNLEKISLAYSQPSVNKSSDVTIKTDERIYFVPADIFKAQIIKNQTKFDNVMREKSELIVYYDSPAYVNKITGAIKEIDFGEENYTIRNHEDFRFAFEKLKPSDEITLKTTSGFYNVTLAQDPENSSKAFLGTRTFMIKSRLALILNVIFFGKKDPSLYYEPKYSGEIARLTVFINNLFIWLILICISVMIINMLPFGIFDGGRFFYLTILLFTKSKEKAFKAFKFMNSLIIFMLILLMAIWFFRIL